MQDETIFIIFAELARFDRELGECENDLERMLYVIKNGWRLQNQPVELRKEIFKRLLDACEIAAFDEEKRIQYDRDMYDERRRNGELATAKRLGREEGREQGREEAKLEAAKKFKELGVDIETIVQATGLSVDVVEGL